MNKYSSIEELIRLLQDRILETNKLIGALMVAPETTEQEILLKYIETRSTTRTANFMRQRDIRTKHGNSYLPADVSRLIKDGHDSLDLVLLKFAQEIFHGNKKMVNRRYN
jgi:hypothetical protein